MPDVCESTPSCPNCRSVFMRHPSTAEVEKLAEELSIRFSDDELETYVQIIADTIDLFAEVERIPKPQLPPGEYEYTDRAPGYEPDQKADPYNAWITRCHVEGADTGPLSGMTVGLKDSISLAGVRLTNGSSVMEGYVPSVDATIVSRLLDAGATITGKNNMWSFSLGPSDYGPPTNPNAPEYSIGGSSSGTAAAVAAGDVDIGIGGDQGGSIRIPASFGGLVGLKPTHGLVPYTGIFGADPSLDHTGPITRTTEKAALTMEVLAGRDGLDPRQPHDLEVQPYTDALGSDVSDMTVGVLEEGFGHDVNDPEVNAVVRDAIADLEAMGADVVSVSVPGHLNAGGLNYLLVFYGAACVLDHNGTAVGFDGWYDTDAVAYLGRALTARSSDLPPEVKAGMVATEYVRRHYQGSLYCKAQNITLELRAAYDAALEDVDAFVMPTCPIKPPASDRPTEASRLADSGVGFDMGKNTALFDLTHHPALTVPCGTTDGAPTGLMFVGERFDEATLFRLGYAYEQNAGP